MFVIKLYLIVRKLWKPPSIYNATDHHHLINQRHNTGSRHILLCKTFLLILHNPAPSHRSTLVHAHYMLWSLSFMGSTNLFPPFQLLINNNHAIPSKPHICSPGSSTICSHRNTNYQSCVSPHNTANWLSGWRSTLNLILHYCPLTCPARFSCR